MVKRILLLVTLGLVFAGLIVADGRYSLIQGDGLCTLTVTDAGDTSGVLKFNEFSAMDSFDYEFDLEDATNYTVDSLVKWTSPLMVTRITVTGPTDSTQDYACSLDCGTNVYGFSFQEPSTDTTTATLVTMLTDSINNTAGIEDTVTAEDSVTYCKVTWKIAQNNLEGGARGSWIFVCDGTVLDTASTITTIAMVCDSMAATVAATDSIKDHYTAANDGDTVFTLTANKKGKAFTCDIADTSLDVAEVTANKVSSSETTDSIYIGNTYGYGTMLSKIYVGEDNSPNTGVGVDDSLILWLYSVLAEDKLLLDSTCCAAFPGSLMVVADGASTDTLLREGLMVKYLIRDTCTDSNHTVEYPISWHILLK